LSKRRVVAIAAAGVLAGLLASCGDKTGGSAPQQSGEPPRRLTFKVVTTDTVTSLDPAGPYEIGSRTLQANLYQTLLTITGEKPTPVPDAADCQFDAPTIYTCSLKSGLSFPNGHPLTSSDVKFSFDRLMRLKTPGGIAGLFGSIATISTPDELTATFTLKKPDARLPYLLTTTAASIVDEEVYPANKLLGAKAVGSGPYELTAYTPGVSAALTKFKRYKGPRAAQNDGIDLTVVRDSAALSDAVTTGKADLAFHGFGATDLDKLRTGGKVQVVEAPSAEIRYFSFHFKSATSRRPAVRRAVAQLIDRSAIAKKAYGDQVTPLYSVVPPGFGGHVDAFRAEYKEPNKTAAATILREGGVTTPVPLTLGWTPTRYGAGAKAEVTELKRQLDASGLFRVTLRSVPWPRYQQLARSGAFDLYHSGWLPDYPDSDDYLAPFVREGAIYQNGYRSQTASKLLDQEVAEQNQLEREQVLEQAQAVIAHDAAVIPVWQGRLTVVAGQEIKNPTSILNPLSYLTFSTLRK
jgi:peptide/nickel transport system substrate-binding protein